MGAGDIMANGQMNGAPPAGGPPQQAPPMGGPSEQAPDQNMQGPTEDMIINEFISRDMAFTTFMNEVDSSIPYNTLSNRERQDHDLKSFKFYNDKYVEQIVNDENAPQLTIENFILMHNPAFEFRNDLIDFNLGSKNTSATDWEGVYKGDTELHKKSAIEGYKKTLLAMGEDPGVDSVG